MRLVVHKEIPSDRDVAGQWNDLLGLTERPEIFYSYEWALAQARAYRSFQPLLILGYEGDSLAGVAALATDAARHESFFLAGTTADYCDFISRPEHRGEFISLVLAKMQRLGTRLVALANLPADSVTAYALKSAAAMNGYLTFSRPAYACAQVTLGSSHERQGIKQKIAGRKTLRTYLRGLSKEGPIAVEHLTSWDSIQTALPEFVEAHVARFAAVGRTSNLADPERQRFIEVLAELLCAKRAMVLNRLRAGDRSVAWCCGFQFAGSWLYYLPTFDVRLRQFSPGFCLLSKIIEAACDDPEIERIDLGLGAEPYKERFATGTRQTLHVSLTTSALQRLKIDARYRTASAIKSSPRVEHYVRRLLGRSSPGAEA